MTFQHTIEEAHHCGYQVGVAQKHRDESLAKFQNDWFRRFLACQPKEDQAQIQQAYDAGYRAGRGEIKEQRFK